MPALPSQEGCRAGRYTHYTGHIQEHGTYCHKYASNSKDVFDKQHLIKGILEQIKMKHWWNRYKTTKNMDENQDLPINFKNLSKKNVCDFHLRGLCRKLVWFSHKNHQHQIQTSQNLRENFIAVLTFDENFACLLFDVIFPKLLLFPTVALTNLT